MNSKEIQQERAEARIKEIEARISLLRAQAERAQADKKAEFAETIKDLQTRREAIEKRIADLTSAGTEAWSELREGIGRAIDELSAALSKATEQIEKEI